MEGKEVQFGDIALAVRRKCSINSEQLAGGVRVGNLFLAIVNNELVIK